VPSKANPLEQITFFDTILAPLMNQAKQGEIALLFADAFHFVMGCDFLGYIYSKMRRFIRTFSGRKRYNVLGALNFITKKVTTITNDTYITAIEICELLEKVSIEYVGEKIYVVLDNARYQKCKIVMDLAQQLGINIVYIPPYSPNLNLIERLWKFVKGKLRTQSYDRFDKFQEKIDSIVNGTNTEYKEAIDRLITEKIQLFDDLVAMDQSPTICVSVPSRLAA
jgi:transposase